MLFRSAGQAIAAGAVELPFTEQQSDISIPLIHFRKKAAFAVNWLRLLDKKIRLFGVLHGLRGKARIGCGFHKRLGVGFCIVEGHHNLLLLVLHVYLGNP